MTREENVKWRTSLDLSYYELRLVLVLWCRYELIFPFTRRRFLMQGLTTISQLFAQVLPRCTRCTCFWSRSYGICIRDKTSLQVLQFWGLLFHRRARTRDRCTGLQFHQILVPISPIWQLSPLLSPLSLLCLAARNTISILNLSKQPSLNMKWAQVDMWTEGAPETGAVSS